MKSLRIHPPDHFVYNVENFPLHFDEYFDPVQRAAEAATLSQGSLTSQATQKRKALKESLSSSLSLSVAVDLMEQKRSRDFFKFIRAHGKTNLTHRSVMDNGVSCGSASLAYILNQHKRRERQTLKARARGKTVTKSTSLQTESFASQSPQQQEEISNSPSEEDGTEQ